MKYKDIEVTIRSGLQIIKFNRPAKKNAISPLMYEEIASALGEGAKNDDVILTALTGAGDYYSSGNDITAAMALAMTDDIDKQMIEASQRFHRYVSAFIDFPKILIAVVNGPAIGAGATTLGLCDIVYASHAATFLTPFTNLGLSAEGCSSYTFPRIMGTSMASEMLYLNRKIDAYEAKACGLVSEIFPQSQLAEVVWPRVERFATLPMLSMNYSKRLVRRWDVSDLREANDRECKQLEERRQSEDFVNATLAFMKRKSKV